MEDRGLDDWLCRNIQSLEFVVQRGQVDAEKLRGFRLMAASPLKGGLNQMSFEASQFVRQADAAA